MVWNFPFREVPQTIACSCVFVTAFTGVSPIAITGKTFLNFYIDMDAKICAFISPGFREFQAYVSRL